MNVNRTKNATRNIIFGITLRIYQIIVPFLMRTAMIYFMGIEYLGLNSLFTSILQVLNLAELGVGSAMVYSMYKPIAEDDKDTICALLKLYKKYYFFIGLVIATIGIIITPMIPKLINGEVPGDINIYVLYILNLSATVITYWLYAYKSSLLQAHQRTDISSKVQLITTTAQYILQFLVLWLTKNYYLYVIAILFTQALANIITAREATKIYPNYQAKGSLPKETIAAINQRIKDLFTAKLGATIVNSADTIVISAYLGLTMLAIYQNYYFIMNSVMSILVIVFVSCLAGIGNSLVTESLDKNYNDFRVITFFINWVVTVCMCCFAVLYQPFITLWVGEDYTFNIGVVALFCIYFYLVTMQQINGMYKDAAGAWHQDRFRPLIVAMINLTLNLTFVRSWGIYAILLSTIVSYVFVSMPWMIVNVFKYVFKRKSKDFIIDAIGYFVIACCVTGISYYVCKILPEMNLLAELIINFAIVIIFSNTVMFVIFRKNKYFNQMIDLADRVTKYKFNRFLRKIKG